ncbi:MAG: hypothetical protein HY074_01580 [Deltaproteobacteria bacterium]|nr:hypothetical protein [Deltaproteobacteria bacterium]
MLKFGQRGLFRSTSMLVLVAFVVQLAAPVLTSVSLAHADPATGNSAVQGQNGANGGIADPCSVTDESAASEQCNEKNLAITAAVIQGGECLAFTTAGTLCAIACAAQKADKKAAAAAKAAADAASKASEKLTKEIPEVTKLVTENAKTVTQGLADEAKCTKSVAAMVADSTKAAAVCIQMDGGEVPKPKYPKGFAPGPLYTADAGKCTDATVSEDKDVVDLNTNMDTAVKDAGTLVKDAGSDAANAEATVETGKKANNSKSPSDAAETAAVTAATTQNTTAIQMNTDAAQLTADYAKIGLNQVNILKDSAEIAAEVAAAYGDAGSGLLAGCDDSAQELSETANKDCAESKKNLAKIFEEYGKAFPKVEQLQADILAYQGLTAAALATATAAQAARAFRESTRKACQISGYVAVGVDVAGGVATMAAGAAITKKIDAGSITGLTASLVMDAAQMSMNGNTKSEEGSQQEEINCPMEPITHFLQAGIRGVNMGMSISQANKASKYALELRVYKGGSAAPAQMTVTSAGPNSGSTADTGASSNSSEPKLLRDVPVADKKKFTASNLAASNATAASEAKTLAPALLEATTGHSADEVNNMLMDGQSPMMAGMTVAGEQMGDMLPVVAALEQNKDQILKELAPELGQLQVAKGSFESTGGAKGHASAGHSGDGMPDMASILAGLQGGNKKKEAGPPGSQAVGFGKPAAKGPDVSSDGFHPASKSLFEIVGTRYQLVTKRFLAGEATGVDAANVPKNIYLRK